jgi:DNA-binding response OmpR family regulator
LFAVIASNVTIRPATIVRGSMTDVTLSNPTIFVIDDDPAVRAVVRMGLAKLNIDVMEFSSAKPALAALDEVRHPSVILLDVALSQSDAVDVVRGLQMRKYNGTVRLMSGARQDLIDAVQRIGLREGVSFDTALHKPFKTADLVAVGSKLLAT